VTDEQAREWGRRALAAGFEPRPGATYVELDAGEGVGDVVIVTRVRGQPPFGWRVVGDLLGAGIGVWDVGTDGHWHDVRAGDCGVCVPDFRDAATEGVLVAQVRERRGDPGIHVVRDTGAHCAGTRVPDGYPLFWVRGSDGYDLPGFAQPQSTTEAAAWLAAMEAAPRGAT